MTINAYCGACGQLLLHCDCEDRRLPMVNARLEDYRRAICGAYRSGQSDGLRAIAAAYRSGQSDMRARAIQVCYYRSEENRTAVDHCECPDDEARVMARTGHAEARACAEAIRALEVEAVATAQAERDSAHRAGQEAMRERCALWLLARGDILWAAAIRALEVTP